ncbi:MAG: hypothetical protein H6Q90_3705 [Deltaproteobacteria bacterium]|nr:hypothetical protein [Deltaproteobacteria bacterium]
MKPLNKLVVLGSVVAGAVAGAMYLQRRHRAAADANQDQDLDELRPDVEDINEVEDVLIVSMTSSIDTDADF